MGLQSNQGQAKMHAVRLNAFTQIPFNKVTRADATIGFQVIENDKALITRTNDMLSLALQTVIRDGKKIEKIANEFDKLDQELKAESNKNVGF